LPPLSSFHYSTTRNRLLRVGQAIEDELQDSIEHERTAADPIESMVVGIDGRLSKRCQRRPGAKTSKLSSGASRCPAAHVSSLLRFVSLMDKPARDCGPRCAEQAEGQLRGLLCCPTARTKCENYLAAGSVRSNTIDLIGSISDDGSSGSEGFSAICHASGLRIFTTESRSITGISGESNGGYGRGRPGMAPG
jgi:hypothetical protein